MDDDVSPAITDMIQRGQLEELDSATLDAFLAGDGLAVLLFTGGSKRVRESHDVAVALREIMKAWPGQVRAAVFKAHLEAGQSERFRVITAPSLVFLAGGATLEVLPGVRDWLDYAAAFRRYLGTPQQEANG